MVKLSLLVLCGIPGAGKTKLCRSLLNLSEKKPLYTHKHEDGEFVLSGTIPMDEHSAIQPSFKCYHVCYDSIIPDSGFKKQVMYDEGLSEWKLCRQHVVNMVDIMISQILSSNICSKICSDIPDDLLQRFCELIYPLKGPSNRATEENILILIDDNMYYKSMRYSYYQIAREYNIGFLELYIECPVEIALKNNFLRTTAFQVPASVIKNMIEKIESPSDKVHWEKDGHIIIKPKDMDVSYINVVIDILNKVKKSWDNPVVKLSEENLEHSEEARQICSKNLIHQCDQILRQLVSHRMKSLSEIVDKQDLKLKGKCLSSVKTEILGDISLGKYAFQLNEDQIADSSKDPSSALYKTVEKMFVDMTDLVL